MARRASARGFFLSLYGGVGRCAEEASRVGMNGAVVDMCIHEGNDLSTKRIHDEMVQALYSGKVLLVGIELVCDSWSIARRALPGSRRPSAVRSKGKYIWGLPNLPDKDKIKVRQGSNMAKNALQLIRICLELDIPGYLEIPQTSRLFNLPAPQRLIDKGRVRVVITHMCQYCVPWRKATTFLI